MKLKQMLFGIATFLPGMQRYKVKTRGGTVSARYCYGVWLRHLVLAHQNGLNSHPAVVAELGPGNSLGIGLAALLSGSERCFALDVVEHANITNNLTVFDELVRLFSDREPIPDAEEFPAVKPYLNDYAFPSDILTEARMRAALHPDRVADIKSALLGAHGDIIQYKVPWQDANVIEEGAVDMIFSQAVLEHVDDLHATYEAMRLWLSDTGFISHQVDFKSHGLAEEWNGHWRYSDFVWALFRGRQSFLINRHPHSVHLAALEQRGFELRCNQTVHSDSKYALAELAPRFRSMTEQDLLTSGAFLQAQKQSTS